MGANAENVAFTQGLYDARELAMGRMQHEAQAAGAEGVVGVTVTEGSHGWDSHIREFFVLGCGVVSMGAGGAMDAARVVIAAED
jgi:uncharacterized protein YbjQ (UPF0145 family)